MRKRENKQAKKLGIALIATILVSYILLYSNWISLFNQTRAATKNGTETQANVSGFGITGSTFRSTRVATNNYGTSVIVWKNEGGGLLDNSSTGIYMQLFNQQGQAQLPSTIAPADQLVNTTTLGSQNNPAVAMDKNGNFIVVWDDNNNGGIGANYDVWIQAYDNTGTKIGSAVRVSTVAEANLTIPYPDVSLNFNTPDSGSSKLVVVYNYSTDGTNIDVRKVDLTVNFNVPGAPVISAAAANINTYTTDVQSNPRVAMNTNSEYIVTWWGKGPGFTDSNNIWYRSYDSTHASLEATETKVNSSTLTTATYQTIAADKRPRTINDSSVRSFFIAYQGTSAEDSSGIFGRQITCSDPDATNGSDSDLICSLKAVEIKVNTTTSASQFPDIAADYSGNFTVTWETTGAQDGSGKGIYAQNYKYTGTGETSSGQLARYSSEFKVNTATTGDQYQPAIGMELDGSYIIAYLSTGGSTTLIFQKYVSYLYKADRETLANSADLTTQSQVRVAIAPNGNYAAVWKQNSPQGIYYTLWDSNNNVIVQNQRIDGTSGVANDDSDPAISFFKDATGSNVGRFVIAWSESVPGCGTSYAPGGKDIWYREVLADGTAVGSCEKKVHAVSENDDIDNSPQIAAGYYNTDGSANEDNFAIIYLHQPSSGSNTINTAFHSGDTPAIPMTYADFTYGTANTSCTNCLTLDQSVALNPNTNRIVYSWSDIDESADNGIYIRQANSGTLLGTEQRINPLNGLRQVSPSIAWLPNNQFVVSYTEYNLALTASTIKMARLTFDGSGDPATIVDSDLTASTLTGASLYSRISSDLTNGTFLVAGSDNADSRISGQIFKYNNITAGGLAAFGPLFFINSTIDGSRGTPSVDLNNATNGMIAGWDGKFETNVGAPSIGDDNAGAIIQPLFNPLFVASSPELNPEIDQVVNAGGRVLSVPDAMTFPNAIISNPLEAATSTVSLRGNTLPDPDPIQYIEFIDLDGTPAVITVSSENFIRTSDLISYISATNLAVKNCDQDVSTNALCKTTLNGEAGDFHLDTTPTADNTADTDVYYSFSSELDQKTLATKTGGNLGKWRFFPKFKLTIPASTPAGDHTTTITFSLT